MAYAIVISLGAGFIGGIIFEKLFARKLADMIVRDVTKLTQKF